MEKTMTTAEIMNALEIIRNGTMARIKYVSSMPVIAKYAKQGYKITKETETTARFGVNYGSLPAVKAMKADPDYKPRTSNSETIIKNKLYRNSTGNECVRFVPIDREKSSNKVVCFTVETPDGEIVTFTELPDRFKAVVRESYFSSHKPTIIQTVNINNVLFIKNKHIG